MAGDHLAVSEGYVHGRGRARLEAFAALALGAITLGLAMLAAWRQFPVGLIALACVTLGLYLALFGLVHRGVTRALALAMAVSLVAGSAGRCSPVTAS